MKDTTKWLLVCLVMLAALAACSGGSTLGISDVWARPGNTGGNSAIYLIVDNPTGQADSLLMASSAVADTVELHSSSMGADGMMMMEHQENIPVPAGEKIEFKPGGLHVMLIGLKNDLKAGDTFQVTLKFEKSGEKTLDVTVKEP